MPREEALAVVEQEAPHLRRYCLALSIDDDLAEGLESLSVEAILGYLAFMGRGVDTKRLLRNSKRLLRSPASARGRGDLGEAFYWAVEA